MKPYAEYAKIPQTIPVDKGVMIRITDYPHKGLWRSTDFGWERVEEQQERTEDHMARIFSADS